MHNIMQKVSFLKKRFECSKKISNPLNTKTIFSYFNNMAILAKREI